MYYDETCFVNKNYEIVNLLMKLSNYWMFCVTTSYNLEITSWDPFTSIIC